MAIHSLATSRVSTAAPRLAIFDLDRTLLAGSSLVTLAAALQDHGVVAKRHVVAAAARGAVFARLGEGAGTVDRVCRQALACLAGAAVDEVRAAVDDAAVAVAASLRPAMLELAMRHAAIGDRVLVVSASPDELVRSVARLAGFDLGVGTRVEHRNGHLTGRLDGPVCHADGKLARLRDAVGDLDLRLASAYADAASDLPLLTRCGFPCAVNPDRALRAAARDRGWPVLRA